MSSPAVPDTAEPDDQHRPRFRVRPPRGWLNDPNGLAVRDGRYHVFFQHNPDSVAHARIGWGHAWSDDLLRWHDAPVALLPRPGGPDAAGCWSGCQVDDDGVPTLVYSGVADHSGASQVLLARGDAADDQLTRWAVEPTPAAPMPAIAGVTDVRDPFLFAHDGRRWAVQGAGSRAGGARLLLWDATDVAHWEEAGTLCDIDDPVLADVAPADIWECPNLAPLGGRWLLVVSLLGFDDGAARLAGVRWAVGSLVAGERGPRFVAERGGIVDDGPAFYAPQVLLDDDHAEGPRVLMWGWSWELDRTVDVLAARGWAGVLTAPRELHLVDGALRQRLPAELRVASDAPTTPVTGPIGHRTFSVRTAGPGLLAIGDADGTEHPVVDWDGPATVCVDGSLIEVFPDAGPTRTTRGYRRPGDCWQLVGADEIVVWEDFPA